MKYLVIYGTPTRQFFRNPAESAEGGTATIAKHALLKSISALTSKVSGDGNPENPNMEFELVNDFGQLTELFAIPPLGARAALMDGSDVVFEGIVKSLSYGSPASLSVLA